jgi:apoptosis-inducing factor 2
LPSTIAFQRLPRNSNARASAASPRTHFSVSRCPVCGRRDERGYVRVDEHMRVAGQAGVFALGDVSDADRDMAGVASRQAGVVAGNVRALIEGSTELQSYETLPPLIAIPLRPGGGASALPDGPAGAKATADIKGRDMLVDRYASLFDAAPEVAA